jgi:hypothetical protein
MAEETPKWTSERQMEVRNDRVKKLALQSGRDLTVSGPAWMCHSHLNLEVTRTSFQLQTSKSAKSCQGQCGGSVVANEIYNW